MQAGSLDSTTTKQDLLVGQSTGRQNSNSTSTQQFCTLRRQKKQACTRGACNEAVPANPGECAKCASISASPATCPQIPTTASSESERGSLRTFMCKGAAMRAPETSTPGSCRKDWTCIKRLICIAPQGRRTPLQEQGAAGELTMSWGTPKEASCSTWLSSNARDLLLPQQGGHGWPATCKKLDRDQCSVPQLWGYSVKNGPHLAARLALPVLITAPMEVVEEKKRLLSLGVVG
jgi:hypothetical protein